MRKGRIKRSNGGDTYIDADLVLKTLPGDAHDDLLKLGELAELSDLGILEGFLDLLLAVTPSVLGGLLSIDVGKTHELDVVRVGLWYCQLGVKERMTENMMVPGRC